MICVFCVHKFFCLEYTMSHLFFPFCFLSFPICSELILWCKQRKPWREYPREGRWGNSVCPWSISARCCSQCSMQRGLCKDEFQIVHLDCNWESEDSKEAPFVALPREKLSQHPCLSLALGQPDSLTPLKPQQKCRSCGILTAFSISLILRVLLQPDPSVWSSVRNLTSTMGLGS